MHWLGGIWLIGHPSVIGTFRTIWGIAKASAFRGLFAVYRSRFISDRRTCEKVTKHLSETEEGVTNTNECNLRFSVGFTFNSRRTSLSRTSLLDKEARQTERRTDRQEQRARPPWNLHTQHPSPSLPLCIHKSGHNG